MVKRNLLTKVLLLFALIVGSSSVVWADNIATATFNGKNATYTEGWTTTGTGVGRTDCIIIGKDENITSPEFDLSGYSSVKISINARRYGTLSDKKATIDVSIGGESVGTTEATGTDATTSLTDITFTPTKSMTKAVFVFTCTNATSEGSTHGAGINTITITGEKASTGTLESIVLSGEYPKSFYVGDTFSHEGIVVTATYSDQTTANVTEMAEFSKPDMTKVGNQTVTVSFGGQEATYTITITEKPSHTATFSVNGETTEATVKEGEAIDFPTGIDDIAGKKFVGWVAAEIQGTTDDAPEFVTSATMGTENVTFFAVFATRNGSVETATFTASHTGNSTEYDDHTYTDDKENTWNGNTNEPYEDKVARIGLRNNKGSYLESPTFAGNVTAISIKTYNGSGKNRTFYINSEKGKSKKGDLGTLTAPANEKLTTEHDAELGTMAFNKFFIEVSDALGFSYIKVTYSSLSYSDYCTTVVVPTATITDARYATFSNENALDFSANQALTVYTATDNGKSVKLNEVTTKKVPANTPVILKGEAGDYPAKIISSADALGDNDLCISDGTTATAEANIYVLANKTSNGVGFYKWAGTSSLSAGKIYLQAKATSPGAPFLGFDGDGETTGISSLTPALSQGEGVYYDLSGRRVAQPTKGLYIVNGKKVLVP